MKTYKFIAIIIILLSIGLATYSYLNITGSDIEGVSEITKSNSVIIGKRSIPTNKLKEYVLGEKQIEELKKLVESTKFTKKLFSSAVTYDGDHYEITASYDEPGLFLRINSLGNDYISVAHQFRGKHLKIRNPEWKETIEKILTLRTDLGQEKEYYLEPRVSTIEGTLIKKMYYGPPGYGENPDTDAKHYPFILQIEFPIDVKKIGNGTHSSDKLQVDEIQVVAGKEEIEILKQYENKHIVIQGTLFEAVLGPHYTEVLIDLEKILE